MLKMVDGSGVIGVDMVCPLGGTVSPPQPPNYDRVELEGAGMLVLPNSLDAPLERLELGGKTEQVQTTGAQLFDIAKCPLEHNGISFKIPKSSGDVVLMDRYVFEENTQYTISAQKTTSKNENSAVFKFEYVDGSRNEIKVKDIAKKSLTSMSGKTVKRFLVVNPFVAVDEVFNFQFEKGVTATPYEPYTGGKPSPSPEYPQEIKNSGKWNEETRKYEVDVKVTGKNLLNLRNPSVRFDRCILQEDGSIKSDIRSNYYFCSIYVDDPYVVDNIKNDQAITFSIGKGIQSRSITISLHGERVGSVNYQEKSSVPGGNSVSIVPSGFKKVSKIELRFNRSGSLFTDTETVVRDFMIHFGESTPYQPYKEQTLTLTSDRPITKWDRLVEQGGEIGWLYKSKVYDGFDGKNNRIELGNKVGNVQHFSVYFASTPNGVGNANSYCDKYIGVNVSWAKEKFGIFCDWNNGVKFFSAPNEKVTNLEEFKAWLIENPLGLAYETLETEFIPLPQSEQNAIRALKTYYPTTVITVDGGELDPDIKVTYRKEI